jgi:cytochrome P450
MRPALGTPIAVIFSHSVAEQCAKPSKTFRYSLPKSYTNGGLSPVLGAESILLHEGEEWKAIRKRFNPGFAPTHLVTLLPIILERTKRFIVRLDERCKNGGEFELEDLCTALTFDIIGAVALDVDLNSQCDRAEQHPIVRDYADLLPLFTPASGGSASLTSPVTRYKRRKVAKQVDMGLKKVVLQKFEDLQGRDDSTPGSRSIVELALRDADELTPQILQETVDQVKTFMFAGHDTTSTMLQWIFYLLSIHPKVLATLTAELDSIFGPGASPDDVAAQLLERGEEALKQLQYTSAIIKETLRLYPPAGSARMVPKDQSFMVHDPNTGAEIPLYGIVYLCHHIIMRDKSVYGLTANKWVPERWLGNTDTSMDSNDAKLQQENDAIPVSAWRPFERGPRNCIGQELANIEARVIIACAARRYKFTKVGVGEMELDGEGKPIPDEDGVWKVKSEMYSRQQITSKPVDGMKVRVSFSSEGRHREQPPAFCLLDYVVT